MPIILIWLLHTLTHDRHAQLLCQLKIDFSKCVEGEASIN